MSGIRSRLVTHITWRKPRRIGNSQKLKTTVPDAIEIRNQNSDFKVKLNPGLFFYNEN